MSATLARRTARARAVPVSSTGERGDCAGDAGKTDADYQTARLRDGAHERESCRNCTGGGSPVRLYRRGRRRSRPRPRRATPPSVVGSGTSTIVVTLSGAMEKLSADGLLSVNPVSVLIWTTLLVTVEVALNWNAWPVV